MEDRFIMSKKELERKTLLEAYIHNKLSLGDIAKKLDISYRQVKRIWRSYQREKDAGLIHKGRGRSPYNAYSTAFRSQVTDLYQQKYLDFGPTFAAEKMLADDHLAVHPETLRLWLKSEGLWTKKRKRKMHRELRERRPSFGDLLQIDGSIHSWFGEEEKHCLLNIVDDATGITHALLDTGETTEILLRTFKKWVEMYGLPNAVYVDLKSVYVSPKRLKEKFDDDLLIKEGFSVFEEVCKALNITIIKAYSAEAKGRVERKHRVFQDRFVKDIKLYGIKNVTEANQYLETKFIPHINKLFSKEAREQDTHRDPKSYGDLNQIFCWTYRRQVKNDWTIQFKREYFQIKNGSPVIPKEIITIKKYLDGSMKFWLKDKELQFSALNRKPIPPSKLKKYYEPKGEQSTAQRSATARANKGKSPFNRFNPGWLSNKNNLKKESIT